MKKILAVLNIGLYLIASFAYGTEILKSKDVELFEEVLQNIQRYYYQDTDKKVLLKTALQGMVMKLDPHSDFLDPEDVKDLEDETSGKFGGIGVEIVPDRGSILVVSPIDDTPAYKAGIKSGDYIIQINGVLVKDLTLKKAVSLIRGTSGSQVKLMVVRKNVEKPIVFNVKREIISVKSVRSTLLIPHYAYLRLSVFQEQSPKEVKETIAKFLREDPELKGVILDLRDNPGGLLEASVEVADLFLDGTGLGHSGLIVYTESKVAGFKISAHAHAGDVLNGLPMVVLINGGSASASEIVAGALQDHRRALIVGNKSFGKGSVQVVLPLKENNALKLTTSIYFTPSGRSIQAEGVKPDVEIEEIPLNYEALKNKVDMRLRIEEASFADYIRVDKKNASKQKNGEIKSRYKETFEILKDDYQLYEAVQLLQGLSSFDSLRNFELNKVKNN